ncbi:hypothetical protein GQ607_000083 [Colletotrichum asianum]|uniref:Uncharacterized protein n=1 Tax=Colletotrichum asianum TaxID=702518 RepID=A0A8H3WTL9_9PEZI|nr:hypothetical protein GQ607_000083 [Colletotrichum asianum]
MRDIGGHLEWVPSETRFRAFAAPDLPVREPPSRPSSIGSALRHIRYAIHSAAVRHANPHPRKDHSTENMVRTPSATSHAVALVPSVPALPVHLFNKSRPDSRFRRLFSSHNCHEQLSLVMCPAGGSITAAGTNTSITTHARLSRSQSRSAISGPLQNLLV